MYRINEIREEQAHVHTHCRRGPVLALLINEPNEPSPCMHHVKHMLYWDDAITNVRYAYTYVNVNKLDDLVQYSPIQ